MQEQELTEGPERWPECHAGGSNPEGYSEHEEACPQCPDKFTCLPMSVEKGLTRGIEADPEVVAVTRGKLSLADALARLTKRSKLLSTRQEVPQELLPEALREEPANEQMTPEEPPPPLTLIKTPPPPPGSMKVNGTTRPKRNWDSTPKEISEQEMSALLAPTRFKERGVRVGQPFTLEVGMRLVRHKRDRVVVVALRATGFEFAGKIYPTLSAAAIASEHRSVSGNDFFSLEHPTAEIWAADGAVLARGEKKHLPSDAPEDTTAVST